MQTAAGSTVVQVVTLHVAVKVVQEQLRVGSREKAVEIYQQAGRAIRVGYGVC